MKGIAASALKKLKRTGSLRARFCLARCAAEWLAAIRANAGDRAIIMTADQVKPQAEAEGEISYGTNFMETVWPRP